MPVWLVVLLRLHLPPPPPPPIHHLTEANALSIKNISYGTDRNEPWTKQAQILMYTTVYCYTYRGKDC